MPYREKKIYSGAMLEIERVHCHSCGRVIGRRGRGLPTGKAQEKINLRNAQLRLARLLCENFKRGDYHVALTFGKELERDEQQKILARFLRRLRLAFRRATGRELRYVCVCERTVEHGRTIIWYVRHSAQMWMNWPRCGMVAAWTLVHWTETLTTVGWLAI